MGSYYRERHTNTTTTANLPTTNEPDQPNLDDMTKDELLDHAQNLGLDVKQAMTKAEIRAAIDNAA